MPVTSGANALRSTAHCSATGAMQRRLRLLLQMTQADVRPLVFKPSCSAPNDWVGLAISQR